MALFFAQSVTYTSFRGTAGQGLSLLSRISRRRLPLLFECAYGEFSRLFLPGMGRLVLSFLEWDVFPPVPADSALQFRTLRPSHRLLLFIKLFFLVLAEQPCFPRNSLISSTLPLPHSVFTELPLPAAFCDFPQTMLPSAGPAVLVRGGITVYPV